MCSNRSSSSPRRSSDTYIIHTMMYIYIYIHCTYTVHNTCVYIYIYTHIHLYMYIYIYMKVQRAAMERAGTPHYMAPEVGYM